MTELGFRNNLILEPMPSVTLLYFLLNSKYSHPSVPDSDSFPFGVYSLNIQTQSNRVERRP